MYACIPEIGRGFFEGVCPPSNTAAHLRDPPPHTIRELAAASLNIAAGHFGGW